MSRSSYPLIGISSGSRPTDHTGSRMLALRSTYTHAVQSGGGLPVAIPSTIDENALRGVYEQMDGVILSGGGDVHPDYYEVEQVSLYTNNIDRQRDEIELHLAHWAIEDDKPLLAICRGHQILNVALGGTLIQDIREEVDGAIRHDAPAEKWFDYIKHDIELVSESALQMALGIHDNVVGVNSLHHQAIDRLASELEIVARAPDGIIEGVVLDGKRFVLGVQWHPEAMVDDHPPMLSLFRSLVEAVRQED